MLTLAQLHEQGVRLPREVDVLLGGGGTAGAVAGIAAAREGLGTLVVEQFGFLGGTQTAALVTPMMPNQIAGLPLNAGIDRDLETIVMKCMAKAQAQRYSSALALAYDLTRCLQGDPIEGRRSGLIQRAWRFARRNRAATAAAGVVAAVQTTRMGKTVALIEPGKHLGGLTSGGLGATDIGNKAAIGGIARDFYRRVAQHYDKPDAWKYQTRESYRSNRQRADEAEMWTFEPHVAEQILRDMIRDADVPVFFGERLDLKSGVAKRGGRIQSISMESGREFLAKLFIDATYEGDLMAKAGKEVRDGAA
jgi:flavin-dependent dehydrogenase